MIKKRVILIGFMGAGKSCTGKLLSEKTGLVFYDTDSMLEEFAGKSIPEIFRERGEAGFRLLEQNIFSQLPGGLIAAGGGSIHSESVRNILKSPENLVIWLKTDWSEITDRLRNSDRPLVKKNSEEELHCLYKKRIPLYKECADLTIDDQEFNLNNLIGIIQQHFSDNQ